MSFSEETMDNLEQVCRQLQAQLNLTYEEFGACAGCQLVIVCQPEQEKVYA